MKLTNRSYFFVHEIRHLVVLFMVLLFVVGGFSCDGEKLRTKKRDISLQREAVDSLLSGIGGDSLALHNYMKIAVTSNDNYAEMMTSQLLGDFCFENHRYEKAIEYHHNALHIAELLNDGLSVLKAWNALGRDYEQRGELNDAADYYFKVLNKIDQFNDHIGNEIQIEKAIALNGLRTVLLKQNQTDEGQTSRFAEMWSEYEKTQYAKAEKKKQDGIRILLITITVLIGLVLVIYYDFRDRKKKNKAILKLESMKSDYCMDLSNEFKTPVSVIRGLVEILKNNIEGEDKSRALINLDILSRESENLLFHIDGILSALSIRYSPKPAKQIHDDMVIYMGYLYECMRGYAEAKKIDFTFRSELQSLAMDYSPDYIRIVVNTLLSNAFNRCKPNDTIVLSIGNDGMQGKCILTLSDTGESIPKKELPYLFSAFLPNESDKAENKGHNVELFFAKQLIEKFNGHIEAKSDPHKGTVFTVILPVTHRCACERKAYASADLLSSLSHVVPEHNDAAVRGDKFDQDNATYFVAAGASENGKTKKPVVLIVGDNKNRMRYLASILQSSYGIAIAENEKEALQIVENEMPELIIAEALTLQVNGFKLCKKIKGSNTANAIPVILITSKLTADDRVHGFKCGADAFLAHPFSDEELLAVIEQLLNNRKLIKENCAQIMGNSNHTKNALRKGDMDFLERVTNIIYRESGKTGDIISLLASEMCLSTSQLNRRIKAATGLTTTNYILKVRLNKAKKLLMKSQKPIGEIAMDCGFNDFAYFSRSFKKEFGMTPTSFQRLPHCEN